VERLIAELFLSNEVKICLSFLREKLIKLLITEVLSVQLMPNPGDCIWSWFGKSSNLPSLERINELLVQTFIILMHVFAYLTDYGEGFEPHIIIPHKS
jgi:hypothetical protein